MPPRTTSPSAELKAKFPETLEWRKPSGQGKVIILPYPPSYNRYWRTGSKGSHISSEGKRYKIDAEEALERYEIKLIDGPVAVYLDFYRPIQSGDLDNRFKQVLDALQGKCYYNDSQITEIHATRDNDRDNPRVEVRVVPGRPETIPAKRKPKPRPKKKSLTDIEAECYLYESSPLPAGEKS